MDDMIVALQSVTMRSHLTVLLRTQSMSLCCVACPVMCDTDLGD